MALGHDNGRDTQRRQPFGELGIGLSPIRQRLQAQCTHRGDQRRVIVVLVDDRSDIRHHELVHAGGRV